MAALSSGFEGELIDVTFLSGRKRMKALVPTNELWVAVKDVLVYEDYELYEDFRLANLSRESLVIDAGSFVGLFSLKASAYAGNVISIEPSVSNYALLCENLKRNDCGNITALNKALSDSVGHTAFRDAGTSSSLLGTAGEHTYDVATTTIAEVISERGHVDLIKMDIEGSEFPVLLGAKISDLKRIDRLVAELHFRSIAETRNAETLVAHLKEAGMSVKVLESPIRSARYGFSKPWRCSLKGFTNGSSLGYRFLLSGLYGAAPLTKHLRSVYDAGSTSILFASRLHALG